MADLIAQGDEPQERWRRTLPQGERVTMGRCSGAWAVPWDPHISRRHVELRFEDERLTVRRLGGSRNPVFFHGRETEQFTLSPGEHFVIGGTTFTLAVQRVAVTADVPPPLQQQAYSASYLKQVPFHNPDHRIEVLSRLSQAVSGATGDGELCVRLVSLLLAGIPRADTAAVAQAEGGPVRVLHWDQRFLSENDFAPSERLIREALRQEQSVLHIWQGAPPEAHEAFTAVGDFDWAFCTPVAGKGCEGWALYVAGRFAAESSSANDVREDMKFTELVAGTLGSLRQMRVLQQHHASLRQFFSPVVLESLSGEDPEVVLAPRETEVSVLFCDLRGFSRETERHAGDLMGLLHRVSRALGVMTHQILDAGGVVGDFQGDAAMGFWGWPLSQSDDTLRICRAALAIRREFAVAAEDTRSPLAGFRAGLGLATGKAVAGKIGTTDQVKVTVFGPVVNLASRLEGMTKIVRAPILLDEATARAVRHKVPRGVARVRRLAVVRPYGLDTPLEISELLPPASEYPLLTDEHLSHYEAALDAFLTGRWPEAFKLLHNIPPDDHVTDFLTATIAQHHRAAPADWDGVIALEAK